MTPSGTLVKVSNTIAEGHAQFRHKGFQARALYAFGSIDGADSLSAAIYPPDASDPPTKQIPDSQFGWYVEAGYDFAPLLFDSASFTLTPWLRYEHLNMQSTVSGYAGLPANPTLDTKLLTIGLESKPHPQVVVKLDWVHPTTAAGTITSDEVRLGAGFIY